MNMIDQIQSLSSLVGALTVIIGFVVFISKPIRMGIQKIILKYSRDIEQDNLILQLQEDVKELKDLMMQNIKQDEVTKEGTLAIIRDRITYIYYHYSAIGSIPELDKENVAKLASVYFALGGNSYITDILPQIMELPVQHNGITPYID